jgi:hypothetical protein
MPYLHGEAKPHQSATLGVEIIGVNVIVGDGFPVLLKFLRKVVVIVQIWKASLRQARGTRKIERTRKSRSFI